MIKSFEVGQKVKMHYKHYPRFAAQSAAMAEAPQERTRYGEVIAVADRLVTIQWDGWDEPAIYTPDEQDKILAQ